MTDSERDEMIPSQKARLFDNRVAWTLTHLSKAGALDRPRRSYTRITPRGLDVLGQHPERVDMTVLDGFAEYQTFRGREATEDETRGSGDEPAVWMVRAGRGGIYAPAFIEHGAVIVGWGATGTIEDLSRQEISDHVRDAFPDYGGTKLASAAGVLRRLAGVMAEGDLALTPEPATKTILFGRIDGPYQFLSESIDPSDGLPAHPPSEVVCPRGAR